MTSELRRSVGRRLFSRWLSAYFDGSTLGRQWFPRAAWTMSRGLSSILFASWLLLDSSAGALEPGSTSSELAPPQISGILDGAYEVIKLYAPEGSQSGYVPVPFTIIRDRDVIMMVKNPERWFGQLFIRSGKPDPRAKISTNASVFEAAKRKRAEASILPEGSEERKTAFEESDALEQYWRDFLWSADVKRWLEQSCFLVIEGKRFKDLHPIVEGSFAQPRWLSTTKYEQIWYLRFRIEVTEANKSLWQDLVSGQGFKARPVSVTLGQSNVVDQDTDEIPTLLKDRVVDLQTASLFQMTCGIFVVGLLLLIFLLLATKTPLLQHFGTDALWHMSLGRSQMAFWFLVVLISYVFLWIVTGDYNTLTQSELILLGISATTGLGEILMGESSKVDGPRPSDVLSAREINITNASGFAPLITVAEQDVAAQQARVDEERDAMKMVEPLKELQRLEWRLAELKKREAYFQQKGRRWLQRVMLELVQEMDSPSLHRFQMIAWTLVLGLIFLNSVYVKLIMPTFDSTLLALIGISNGTYLGFKWPTSMAKGAFGHSDVVRNRC